MEYETRTEVREPTEPTHTTIIREKRGSGGMLLVALAVIAVLVAAFLFMRQQDSEIMRDAAITDAAQQVGQSAERAGAAIENAADKVTGE